MLTDTQREYLKTPAGERGKEYTKQQRFYHTQNIHERVRAGILDFRVLMDCLGKDERQQIFDWTGSDDAPDYQLGVRDAVALLYLSQYEQGIPFQRMLQWSIPRAWREIAPEMNVNVDFDVEVHEPVWDDPKDLAERARDGGTEALSEEQVARLMDYASDEGLLDDVLDAVIDSRENRRNGADEPDGG